AIAIAFLRKPHPHERGSLGPERAAKARVRRTHGARLARGREGDAPGARPGERVAHGASAAKLRMRLRDLAQDASRLVVFLRGDELLGERQAERRVGFSFVRQTVEERTRALRVRRGTETAHGVFGEA